jgi:prepilin-type N-terminal cleavage/methylation domain-containing protein
MSMLYQRKSHGFTIVELLIVIVVIGILAAITVVAYNGVQDRARVSRANSELNTLYQAILSARINQNKTLLQVTGSNCTFCYGHSQYLVSLDAISQASGANLTSLKAGDPWGHDYFIDENEGEGSPCATQDSLGISPGHTGVNGINVPFYNCP